MAVKKAKVVPSQVTQNPTKEQIFKASQGPEFRLHFEDPRDKFIAEDVEFNLVDKGRTSFDYDTDSGKETTRVYSAGSYYIALQGVYWSYDGLVFDRWDFVEPKQVFSVQYEKVKE